MFPLRGPHAVTCTSCHVNPASFAVFSCLDCHAHRRDEMDAKHRDVKNYAYDSAACYRCHPRGQE